MVGMSLGKDGQKQEEHSEAVLAGLCFLIN